jgi:hypothetical protein
MAKNIIAKKRSDAWIKKKMKDWYSYLI